MIGLQAGRATVHEQLASVVQRVFSIGCMETYQWQVHTGNEKNGGYFTTG